MKYVIIERGGQFEAHKKNMSFSIVGPTDTTYICRAATQDKCRAILLAASNDLKQAKYRVVEEGDL